MQSKWCRCRISHTVYWHQMPNRCPLGAGTSQTRDAHAAPSGSTAAVDLDRPTRPENSAQQLQRQVAQVATAAGVLVEQIASDGAQSEPVMLAESWQDIVKRVQQLQQEAVPLAQRVKASLQHTCVCCMHSVTSSGDINWCIRCMLSKLRGVFWVQFASELQMC